MATKAAAQDGATKAHREGITVLGLSTATYVQFLLLCVIIELPNRIFFPALVEMGFSGLEPMLAVHLLSALLGIGWLFRMSVSLAGVWVLVSLPGFYLYSALSDHYMRTYMIGVSVVALTLAVQAHFFVSPAVSERWMWGQHLAVALVLCMRYAFKSALPTWSFTRAALPAWTAAPEWSFEAPECDRYTAVVGLVAAAAMLVAAPGTRSDPLAMKDAPAVGVARWGVAGLAFATNMFMTFWLFTCHNVVPRWVGVDPTLYGPGVIVAYMVGCLLGTRWAVLRSPLFGAAGAAGAYLLYYGDPLPAYGGGLVLAVFTAASWPATYAALYRCRAAKGRMMFVGQLAYVFLEFTTVWNIAYMFLDLGDAFREAPHYPLFFSVAVMAFSNMVAEPASARVGDAEAQARPRGVTITGVFAVLLGLALYVRHAHGVTRPHRVVTEPGRVKTMIWNVHTGYADTGYDNYELAAAFLQDMQAGVIAILENDQARPCTANRDQIEYLGASLGFPYHNYGIKTRDSTWGCAFISLYPIKDSNVTVLPSPYGTRSCLIDAVLDVDGHDVNVVVSHFSTEEFPEDLRLQTAALSARTRAKDTMPLVVMCYITSAPTAATWKKAEDRANYGTLVAGQPAGGTLRDPDPKDFDRWCQYIFYKNTVVDKYYHVDTGYMSDTEAQLADVRTVSPCSGDACPASNITAEFYRYDVPTRTLKYWYTGARHRNQRPPLP